MAYPRVRSVTFYLSHSGEGEGTKVAQKAEHPPLPIWLARAHHHISGL